MKFVNVMIMFLFVVTLGQLKAILAAVPSNVPDSTPVWYKPLTGSNVELQNKVKAYSSDVEVWDSAGGIQVQDLVPSRVEVLQE